MEEKENFRRGPAESPAPKKRAPEVAGAQDATSAPDAAGCSQSQAKEIADALAPASAECLSDSNLTYYNGIFEGLIRSARAKLGTSDFRSLQKSTAGVFDELL